MTPIPPTDSDLPEWEDEINGEVKSNGKLHIWSTEHAAAVITSDRYVRPERNGVTATSSIMDA